MKYYIFATLCPLCRAPLQLRQFCASADGGVMIVGWCVTCRKERTFTTDMKTLREWAFNQDHPEKLSRDDADFLKERNIRWD